VADHKVTDTIRKYILKRAFKLLWTNIQKDEFDPNSNTTPSHSLRIGAIINQLIKTEYHVINQRKEALLGYAKT
jgi:hypothetical protein